MIKEQDLGYDVLIKPGEELALGGMEGHGPVDYHDVSLAEALLPREKTLKTRGHTNSMSEGVYFLSRLPHPTDDYRG